MARKRKSTKKKPAAASAGRIQTSKLAVEVQSLEIAAGHDGLLRGAPEPVVLIGAYLVTSYGAPRTRALGRELTRFVPEGRFPLTIAPAARSILKARVRGPADDRVIVLAIAAEEDSGDDIGRLYIRLCDAARLRVWDIDAAVPSPVTIAELAALPPTSPPESTRVNVLDEGVDLRDVCKSDELIGAGVVVVAPHRSEEGFRVRFLSSDRRNDWTALLSVTFH